MDQVQIGRYLAALRRASGLTQDALGEMLGVQGKTISRWETGVYLPPVEMLQALSQRYQLTINELLSGGAADAIPDAQQKRPNAAVKPRPGALAFQD